MLKRRVIRKFHEKPRKQDFERISPSRDFWISDLSLRKQSVITGEKLSWLYFRHYSPREFRFSLFLFNLHGKTLLRFSRYKRQIHGESSRIGKNPSRLERDFLFSFFSLYFSFHHPRESILYFPTMREISYCCSFLFFRMCLLLSIYNGGMNFCVFEMCYSNIYEEENSYY